MNFFRRYAIPLNILVILVTIVFVGAALVMGRAVAAPAVTISVGSPSPEDYTATRTIEVEDKAATAAARTAASNRVTSEYSINPDLVSGVRNDIALFFENLKSLAIDDIEPSEVDLAIADAGGDDVLASQVDNEVILSGTVPDEETRAVIIAAVSAVSGVTAVDDSRLITEAPAEPPSTTSS